MPYKPIDDFLINHTDQSSFPIRDYPGGKVEFSVDIYPENLTFVTDTIDVESDFQTVLVRNTGYADLLIDDVIVVGPYELQGTKPVLLPVDETIALQVSYTGKVEAAMTGGLALIVPNAVGRTFISFTGSVPVA